MRLRHWCGDVKFRGAERGFYVGTVQAESELEAERLLREILRSVVPLPLETEYLIVVPGMVVFAFFDEGKEADEK